MRNIINRVNESLLGSIILLLISLIMIIIPGTSLRLLTILLGSLILGFSIYAIFKYLFSREHEAPLLTIGLIAFLLGLYLVIDSEFLANIAVSIIGFILLFKGIIKTNANSLINNIYGIVIGILQIVLGIILVINPFETMELFLRIVGVVLLIVSIVEMISNKKIKINDKKTKNNTKKTPEKTKSKVKNKNDDATELEFIEKKK